MHLRVTGFVLVFGGDGCRDPGGIDNGAGLQKQATLAQQVVDHSQNLLCEFVFFQPVAQPKDGGFVGQAANEWRQVVRANNAPRDTVQTYVRACCPVIISVLCVSSKRCKSS